MAGRGPADRPRPAARPTAAGGRARGGGVRAPAGGRDHADPVVGGRDQPCAPVGLSGHQRRLGRAVGGRDRRRGLSRRPVGDRLRRRSRHRCWRSSCSSSCAVLVAAEVRRRRLKAPVCDHVTLTSGGAGSPMSSWISAWGVSGMSRRLLLPELAVVVRGDPPADRADLVGGERLVPLVEEVAQRVDALGRRLDVDDPVGGVGVQPVDALAAARPPGPARSARSSSRGSRSRPGARECTPLSNTARWAWMW